MPFSPRVHSGTGASPQLFDPASLLASDRLTVPRYHVGLPHARWIATTLQLDTGVARILRSNRMQLIFRRHLHGYSDGTAGPCCPIAGTSSRASILFLNVAAGLCSRSARNQSGQPEKPEKSARPRVSACACYIFMSLREFRAPEKRHMNRRRTAKCLGRVSS